MIDYTDVDAKLEEYSEAFDIYMESGEMPPTMPEEDCLAGYMKEVIDNNPQIDGTDTTWVEVLKEGLLTYFYQLIQAFASIQQQTEKEMDFIQSFENASIEKKRALWSDVRNLISKKYSKFEVNLEGYTNQFATEETDAVMCALISDWKKACNEHCQQQQMSILSKSQKNWEQSMNEIGNQDYEERRRIADKVYKSPTLQEIVEIIGRAKDSTKEEDNIIYSFLPKGVKSGLPSDDIDRIETGDNLHRTLAVEFAMPDNLFFLKYAEKELQQLAQIRQRQPKKTELHRPKPRPKKGPIIVAVDTSGSMYGRPEEMAKSLLTQLVRIARKEFRSCYLITFSVRIKTIDLGRSANLLKMKEFLETRFTGGNGEEQLIIEALRLLETGDYEMADVLIISDFIFNKPTQKDIDRVAKAKSKGTRFYGLQINSSSTAYDPILDKKWKA